MTNSEQPALPVMHPTGTFAGFTKKESATLMLLQGMLSNPTTVIERSFEGMVDDAEKVATLILEKQK